MGLLDWFNPKGTQVKTGDELGSSYSPVNLSDVQRSALSDLGNLQSLDQLRGRERRGALADFQQAMSQSGQAGRTQSRNATRQGQYEAGAERDWRRKETKISADSQKKSEQAGREELLAGITNVRAKESQIIAGLTTAGDQLRENLKALQTKFGATRDYATGMADKAWNEATSALSGFRSTVASQMAAYQTESGQAHREYKDQLSAELSAQGYRPDEIKAELKKLDFDRSVEISRTLSQTRTAEEMAYRELEKGYYDRATAVQETAANVLAITDASEAGYTSANEQAMVGLEGLRSAALQWSGSTEAGLRSGIAESHTRTAEIERWREQMVSEVDLAVMDNRTQWGMAEQSWNLTRESLEMSGRTELLNQWMNFQDSYTASSDVLSGLFALQVGMEDRYLNTQMAGLSAGASMMGAIGSAVGGLVGLPI
jgi:hypothetical protein